MFVSIKQRFESFLEPIQLFITLIERNLHNEHNIKVNHHFNRILNYTQYGGFLLFLFFNISISSDRENLKRHITTKRKIQ